MSKSYTMARIVKESVIVSIWIGIVALTLWSADGLGLLVGTPHNRYRPTLQVDFPDVYQIWKKGETVFVDARSAASFRRGHIPGAVNVPINRVKQTLSNLPTDKKIPIITYCESIDCPNAYQLMNVLLGHGYQNVRFFTRGMRGWQALGYPLKQNDEF